MLLCPTIQELTNGEFNRYELVVAVAKGTRMVTDEIAERQANIASYRGENMQDLPKKEFCMGYINDEKAMTTVVKRIKSGEYRITYRTNEENKIQED